MQNINLKTKIIIAVGAIIIAITVGIYFYKTTKDNSEIEITEDNFATNTAVENSNETVEENNTIVVHITGEENNTIVVHITGEVNYPGVVVLKEGARVVDAIEAGGGETDKADLGSLNLAYMLSDGEKIYVPNKEETSQENQEREYITSAKADLEQSENGAKSTGTNFKININTAKQEELTQITGVGESTAKKIIEYRTQNGKFKSIEDIKNIPGIGDSKFNAMKEEITVN